MKRPLVAAAAGRRSSPPLAGCTVAGQAAEAGAEPVVVGYQSKTINTVTAGTLLRAQGYFEKRLAELGATHRQEVRRHLAGLRHRRADHRADDGRQDRHRVDGRLSAAHQRRPRPAVPADPHQDGRGHRLQPARRAEHRGRGAELADPVARPSCKRQGRLHQLRLRRRTARSCRRCARAGLDPEKDVKVENQQPPVGASALQSGNVAALSQFVAWPGLLVHQGQATVLYDGGELGVPTLHGTVVREQYATDQPRRGPGVPAGPARRHRVPAGAAAGGRRDRRQGDRPARRGRLPLQRRQRHRHLRPHPQAATARTRSTQDVPFLKSIGVLQTRSTWPRSSTTATSRRSTAPTTTADAAGTANKAALTGTDAVCQTAGRTTRRRPASCGWPGEAAPSRPPTRPACCARSRPRRRPASRSAPRTCRTPAPAPAGSPTRASGYATARRRSSRSSPPPAPSATSPRTPAATLVPYAAGGGRGMTASPTVGAAPVERPAAVPTPSGVPAPAPRARCAGRSASARWSRALLLWQWLTAADVTALGTLRPAAHAGRGGRRSSAALLGDPAYYQDIAQSLVRILTGFALAAVAGIAAGDRGGPLLAAGRRAAAAVRGGPADPGDRPGPGRDPAVPAQRAGHRLHHLHRGVLPDPGQHPARRAGAADRLGGRRPHHGRRPAGGCSPASCCRARCPACSAGSPSAWGCPGSASSPPR